MPAATLVIHGGAGTLLRSAMTSEIEHLYTEALHSILKQGATLLSGGASALDAVTLAVSLLEDCPLFNAGKGSVYTRAGTHEMDAAIMDGESLRAGAIAGVSHLRNPIQAARLVMQHSEHVLLCGAGAESFAASHGAQLEAPQYFHTETRYQQWQRATQQSGTHLDHDTANLLEKHSSDAPIDPDKKFGTVGAVALDSAGNLAAATSTGGMSNKLPGRIGDSPIIGAGCYADNRTAAMSATGTGEAFMRSLALYDIAAQMRYLQRSLAEASAHCIMDILPRYGGRGGIIGIDRAGNIALPFNTEGMYRGVVRIHESPVVAIYANQ